MPTEVHGAQRLALFLFAHQDDEFGVFQQVLDEQAAGRRVVCVYITNGAVAGVTSAQRNAESLRVLRGLGVAAGDIVFAGEQLGIDDGKLPEHLQVASAWLREWLDASAPPEAVYVLAWEGGHQDHDALHAMSVGVLDERGLLPVTRQFALYNAWHCPAPFFRVLKPLPQNGAVTTTPVPWRNRVRFLRYCLSYPSQKRSWVGLFPFVVLRYLFEGRQALQRVSAQRVLERPHEGALFYEARGIYAWDALARHLEALKR